MWMTVPGSVSVIKEAREALLHNLQFDTDATEAAWAPLKSTVLGLSESNDADVLIMVGEQLSEVRVNEQHAYVLVGI